MKKQVELGEAMASIPNGTLLGLGGNTLNRAPMAAACTLAIQGKRDLRLVKTAGAMEVDLLCLAGCVASVDAGFIGYETQHGLCRHYRSAVERGEVKANEHACYTVISALRAASYGLPFMPVKGLQETDLTRVNDYFATVQCPFTGDTLWSVRALAPDVSIVHVHIADERGNAVIEGPAYDDILLAHASKRVIITAERVVGEGFFSSNEIKACIPHFMVSHVVHAPRGASPASCYGLYNPVNEDILAFQTLDGPSSLLKWLQGRCSNVHCL